MDIIPIKYVHDSLLVLDQTRLPNEVVWFSISTRDELYEAIKSLRVRGAPAIGVAAALVGIANDIGMIVVKFDPVDVSGESLRLYIVFIGIVVQLALIIFAAATLQTTLGICHRFFFCKSCHDFLKVVTPVFRI